ncbi:MAG: hypothetical protein OGMRLDGQ_001400 [Candidatus Fervidibacter sp.]|jgi:hypothetical protein
MFSHIFLPANGNNACVMFALPLSFFMQVMKIVSVGS